jgi:hypothetical protein
MSTLRKIVAVLAVIPILSITGCGGSSEGASSNDEIIISVQDPAQPVAADVTMGGAFEGDTDSGPPEIEPDNSPAIIYRDADTNRIARNEIDQTPNFNLENFALAFDRVRASQPNLSTSSDEFARAVIAQLGKSPSQSVQALSARARVAEVFDMFIDLTSDEKVLVLQNPGKAYDSRTAANDAFAATTALFTGPAYLTRADAFRHAYWNWLMSRCCTVGWATAFATAHESQGQNNDDKRMDLNNNMIGRRLFLKSPTSTPAEAQAALLEYQLLWINSKKRNVTVGVDYLVYLEPVQTLTVFDDGPSYDDIYIIAIAGNLVGETPQGGSKAFEFNQLSSGTHATAINCKLDGTKGGCGFEIRLQGASTFSDGSFSTSQIVIQQDSTYRTSFTFPTMKTARTN